ncbi:cobalamin biosynthesis protein CobQ [Paenibacillus sp. FSL H7-0357]|uniref:cobyric acid synthase n=1 Tax=Paenibacillus sp. FSL H7-0357 TaxID=1536774 RepID=UPI0004F6A211|nr:cobyric acid synthase [Paenibacillus sp. FSL H7-0357]AIQ16438.1 cobalamin biosynthesis protein CobQ [Paenibacillus sp. FSL H7-0357]
MKNQADTQEKKQRAAVLMMQGTASDVGKSLVTAAIGRIMTQDGYRTAPFKSQNMALNSYVTVDGKEIGRAQGMQAEAFGITATSDMNPILLKPSGEMSAQIVVHGVPHTALSAREYREKFLPEAKGTVLDALDRLRAAYDIVLMEGAGSPAEINLKARDIVNMNLAGWADAPVLLIADIDRGGVFAFLVGTLELLEPHERARVKGFIINKFRGDLSLLQPGLDWLEQRTGIPVLGVLPFLPQLRIEAEDSVVLEGTSGRMQPGSAKELDIAVIRYPRISNFTDFDPLEDEPDTAVRYVTSVEELGTPDAIILPGTKNTAADLNYLREQGFPEAITNALEYGTSQLTGICGGYQMLGRRLLDPHAVENAEPGDSDGLGYLPLSTEFLPHKTTVRVSGTLAEDHPLQLCGLDPGAAEEIPVAGYEIHMGTTTKHEGAGVRSLFHLTGPDGETLPEGWGTPDGKIWGTYLHGLFHNDSLRRAWLDGIRQAKGLAPLARTFSSAALREQEFDRLADAVRASLDMEAVYRIMGLPGEEG